MNRSDVENATGIDDFRRAERKRKLTLLSFLFCAAGVLIPLVTALQVDCTSEIWFLCADLVYLLAALMAGGLLILLSIIFGVFSRNRLVLLWLLPTLWTVFEKLAG